MLSPKLTLEQMNAQLPNGLHDAKILDFTYDLSKSTLTFTLDVWTGEMQPKSRREMYRLGKLEFDGVASFTKGPAENLNDSQLWFLDWEVKEDTALRATLPPSLIGKKAFSFYVLRCELEIVCDDVSFKWAGEPILR